MAKLSVNCLGSFRASLNGNQLTTFDTDKTRALLVYLLVEGDRPHRREHLAGLLWSDQPEDRALHNLRQSLSSLRRILQDGEQSEPVILVLRDSIQRNPQCDVWMDINVFEQGLSTALAHYQHNLKNRHQDCRLNLRQLQSVVGYFHGPFLNQLYLNGSPLFDEWASMKREGTNQRMIEALTILADLYEHRGEFEVARRYANQITELAPWDETGRVRLMRLLACEGQWSAAISQYRQLRRYLKAELDVEPSQDALRLFGMIRKLSSGNVSMPLLQPVARHNLPAGPSRFVGREDELDLLAVTLADPHCRWLTILGPGGIGKTRLAVEAARLQVGVFGDGISFLPLAAITTEDQLLEAILEHMGLSTPEGVSGVEVLCDFLDGKQMLWVLDNMEQLLPIQANSFLAEIMQRASGVTVLATSRQRVHLAEEHIFLLEGLNYPEEAETPDMNRHTALGLFASRAQQVMPLYRMDDDSSRRSVAMICRLVEGFPLGVELAAAALWGYSVDEIVVRLQEGLGSLKSAAANVTGRHRSLWAAFEISWNLLSPSEQRLLTNLSVFRGGFDAEMVHQMLESDGQWLDSLHDKSLARRDTGGRYDLHEAIRQFAADKLSQDPGSEFSARSGHAGLFAAYLSEQTPRLKGTEQRAALERLAHEWSNVRQAWYWLVSNRCVNELAASVEAIFHFCNIRTRYAEGVELLQLAVAALDEIQDGGPALPRCLVYTGALAFRSNDNDLAQEYLDRARSLLEGMAVPFDLAVCLLFTAGLASRKKDRVLARQSSERALALFTSLGDKWGESYAFYVLGLLESRAGQFEKAEFFMRASLSAAQKSGDQRRQIAPLNVLGDLACQAGQYDRAKKIFDDSLALSRVLQDRFNTSIALLNLGAAYHSLGDFEQAHRHYQESLETCRETGDLAGQAMALANLGELALKQNRFLEGSGYFHEGLALAEKANDPWSVITCHLNLGDAGLGLGDLPFAGTHLREALNLSHQLQEPPIMLRVLYHLARWYFFHKNRCRARVLLDLVIQHPSSEDEHRKLAQELFDREALGDEKTAVCTLDDVAVEESRNKSAAPVF